MSSTPDEVSELIEYLRELKATYGVKPLINRTAMGKTFSNILQDLSLEEAKQLIKFYVDFYQYDLKWFAFNYDTVYEELLRYQEAVERDRQIREETKKRTEEYEKRIARIKGN